MRYRIAALADLLIEPARSSTPGPAGRQPQIYQRRWLDESQHHVCSPRQHIEARIGSGPQSHRSERVQESPSAQV
jgi:hypothetical protein